MTLSFEKYVRRRLSELLGPLCSLPLAEQHGVHSKGAKSLQTHQHYRCMFSKRLVVLMNFLNLEE
jgi:hypothetical protein